MPEERGVSTYNKLAPLYVQSTKYLESKMKRSRLAKLATYCIFLKKKKNLLTVKLKLVELSLGGVLLLRGLSTGEAGNKRVASDRTFKM